MNHNTNYGNRPSVGLMPKILQRVFSKLAVLIVIIGITDLNVTAQIGIPCNPNNPVVVEGAVSDVSCFGYENGAIDIAVSGGYPPYSFNWSNGATTEDVDGLSPGAYQVEVYDNWQCHGTAWFIIGQPSELNLEIALTEQACGQSSGCALMSGGTQPYTLHVFNCGFTDPNVQPAPAIDLDVNGDVVIANSNDYSPSSDIIFMPDPNTPNMRCVDNIPNGLYLVVLTDANGCYDYEIVHIQGNSGPEITGIITEPTCFGYSNGSIDVEISGGTAPYSCAWAIPLNANDLDGQMDAIDPSLINDCSLSNITAGYYYLLVEDVNGCTATHLFHVGQNDPVNLDIVLSNPVCGGQPSGCAYLSGGTGEYHIFIFEGPIMLPEPVDPVVIVDELGNITATDVANSTDMIQVTDIAFPEPYPWFTDSVICADDIPNGHYLVVIVDSNGCYDYEWMHIEGTEGLSVSGTITEPTCFGYSNGSIDVEISGGTAPYSCTWAIPLNANDLDGQMDAIDPSLINDCSLSNITAGYYYLLVEDANGCTVTHLFHVGQNAPVELNIELSNPVCGGQPSGCAFLSGGTGEYHIFIFEGPIMLPEPVDPVVIVDELGNVTATDVANSTDMVQVTDIAFPEPYPWFTDSVICADDIPNGHYLVVIVDSNGCYDYEWMHIEGTDGLSINLTFEQYGEFACANPTGGEAPYLMSWADLSGNIVFPAISQECVYDLPEGVYTVTVTDANGCSETEVFIIDPTLCNEGVAEVNPSEIWSGMGTTFHLSNWSGASLQWQFRTEFTGWLNVPNGNTATFDTPPIYVASEKVVQVRAIVTCADGSHETSNVAEFVIHVLQQYSMMAPPDDQMFGTETTTGIANLAQTVELQVYPSPTVGPFNLVGSKDMSNLNIQIMDMNGRTVLTSTHQQVYAGQKVSVDLAGQTSGMYMIMLRSDQGTDSRRIILR